MAETEDLVQKARQIVATYLHTLAWSKEAIKMNLKPGTNIDQDESRVDESELREQYAEDALSAFFETLRKTDSPQKREAMELMHTMLKRQLTLPLIPKRLIIHLENELSR